MKIRKAEYDPSGKEPMTSPEIAEIVVVDIETGL